MSESNGRNTGATEVIQLPRPSWAPAFFAAGLTLAVTGTFLKFMGPNWAYVVIGLAFVLISLRSMVKGARRDLYRLPREQELTSAPLPAASIKPPQRPS